MKPYTWKFLPSLKQKCCHSDDCFTTGSTEYVNCQCSQWQNLMKDNEQTILKLIHWIGQYWPIQWMCSKIWDRCIVGLVFTNPAMHFFHTPQYTIQNRSVHIAVLNGALWDVGQEHCGIFLSRGDLIVLSSLWCSFTVLLLFFSFPQQSELSWSLSINLASLAILINSDKRYRLLQTCIRPLIQVSERLAGSAWLFHWKLTSACHRHRYHALESFDFLSHDCYYVNSLRPSDTYMCQ